MTKPLPRIVSLLLALALAGAVTGCGGSDDKDGKAGSGSSTTSTGGASGSSSPGGGSSTSDEQFNAQQDKLPKDYPSDDVPLADGKVLYSLGGDVTGNGDHGWTVRLGTTQSTSAAIAGAISKLKSAGFTQQGKTFTKGKTATASLKSDDYTARVVASSLHAKSAVLIYTVIKR